MSPKAYRYVLVQTIPMQPQLSFFTVFDELVLYVTFMGFADIAGWRDWCQLDRRRGIRIFCIRLFRKCIAPRNFQIETSISA